MRTCDLQKYARIAELELLTVEKGLKPLLRLYGLKLGGPKPKLIQRVIAYEMVRCRMPSSSLQVSSLPHTRQHGMLSAAPLRASVRWTMTGEPVVIDWVLVHPSHRLRCPHALMPPGEFTAMDDG